MEQQLTPRQKRIRFLAASLAVHLTVSAIILVSAIRHPAVRTTPRVETRIYPIHLAIPGGMRAPDTHKAPGRKKHVDDPPPRTSEAAHNNPPTPPAGAPPPVPHDPVAGNGTDADNAFPAFPVFSPHPPVSDRSLLPASDREVVVDVNVSALGEVLDATLVKGLGNALDQVVLDTVKTWRFHPATINGNPVATQAELVFPFNQHYRTTFS